MYKYQGVLQGMRPFLHKKNTGCHRIITHQCRNLSSPICNKHEVATLLVKLFGGLRHCWRSLIYLLLAFKLSLAAPKSLCEKGLFKFPKTRRLIFHIGDPIKWRFRVLNEMLIPCRPAKKHKISFIGISCFEIQLCQSFSLPSIPSPVRWQVGW